MAVSEVVVCLTSEGHVEAARDLLPDLLVDRWRPGDNRRSFVALEDGRVVGHARGVDNAVHLDSRVLVLEVLAHARRRGIGTALLAAQLAVSDRPLHVKLYASARAGRALARRFGGVAVQATPPWRYAITAALRAWAAQHGSGAETPTAADAPELLDLEVRHYLDQHAAWSPADEGALRDAFAADVHPGGDDGFDPQRSVVVRRGGEIVAAGLVWPHHPGPPVAGREVSLICLQHGDPGARIDLESCLAGVVDRCDDADVLLIDSHVTESVETAMLGELPGPEPFPGDEWMAIVAIPVPAGPQPLAMPIGLVPAEAGWIEEEFGNR